MIKRGSGILLHIVSLPSPYGIGDFGPHAYEWVDFLNEAKQSYWQILPLNPTEEINGHSPYSSNSAFAGNILLVSPEILYKEGLLAKADLSKLPSFSDDVVDYHKVISLKQKLFDVAFAHFQDEKKGKKFYAEYEMFCVEHAFWLEDYALFVILKQHFNQRPWNQWEEDLKSQEKKALDQFRKKYADDIRKIKFLQFLFYRQWAQLKEYCERKNVQILGDVPIYVNFDSADVWGNQQNYKLNENGECKFVAGVPPDYFSETGQRWGNPVYQWDELKSKGYSWWIQRIKHNLNLFDFIRIDHFRGFAAYWQIPSEEQTAVRGNWMNGPGEDFFNVLKKQFPYLPIIAEDLGIITPDVVDLMNKFEFPGMKVLLFAFGDDLQNNPYLPHNHVENSVVYTGTHDNNTVQGWYLFDASVKEKENLNVYFKEQVTVENVNKILINAALESVANIALVPLQDVLGLSKESRMNIPSTVQGNWKWRYSPKSLSASVKKNLLEWTKKAKRG